MSEPSSRGNLRVLIVEDDEFVCRAAFRKAALAISEVVRKGVRKERRLGNLLQRAVPLQLSSPMATDRSFRGSNAVNWWSMSSAPPLRVRDVMTIRHAPRRYLPRAGQEPLTSVPPSGSLLRFGR